MILTPPPSNHIRRQFSPGIIPQPQHPAPAPTPRLRTDPRTLQAMGPGTPTPGWQLLLM